ncbi:hypothetical protein VTK56DRAFT_2018 [Thermocarpiscus australiensis]
MPRTSTPASKKQQLTLAQLAAYDDILTDALVDHAYYWTTIPKNRTSYHPSRGIREDEITKIIQRHLIVDPNLSVAEEKLLATAGLRKFYDSLKDSKEKEDFKAHLRRYMSIYLPDCPFEINATNRYTIVTYEASITARRFIKRNETIKYLAGIQVTITPEEEAEMSLRKKDFSLVVSSRSKSTSLFMGPARFANHDCNANARLVTRGQAGIEIIACRNIEVGEEITVTYGENYFGEDNCECLCQTCEENLANGWKPQAGGVSVQRSIEQDSISATPGYSLRRRRRDDSATGVGSRTPSVTPDIRPRILKRQKSQRALGDRASTTASADADGLAASKGLQKRTSDVAALNTPPITPAKRLKTSHYEVIPIPLVSSSSRGSSEVELGPSPRSSEDGNATFTDVTSPESENSGTLILSPAPTPIKQESDISCGNVNENGDQQLLEHTYSLPEGKSELETVLPTTESTSPEVPATVTVAAASPPPTVPTVLDPGDDVSANEISPGSSESAHPNSSEESVPIASETESPAEDSTHEAAPSTPDTQPPGELPRTTKSTAKQRKGKASRQLSPAPARRQRVPGDYTLTPLLLSEPETAWIHCTNCNGAFVQKDAYYTRANCARCERHSKLYGYVWPKTAPAGKDDKEERVLDHRTINRFLGPEDEARVRGRKFWKERLGQRKKSTEDAEHRAEEQDEGRGRARTRDGADEKEDAGNDALLGVRRSGRARRASARAVGD